MSAHRILVSSAAMVMLLSAIHPAHASGGASVHQGNVQSFQSDAGPSAAKGGGEVAIESLEIAHEGTDASNSPSDSGRRVIDCEGFAYLAH